MVERVEIGWAAGGGAHIDIANIVAFGDRLMSRDGRFVDPILVINRTDPRGVHFNWKNYDMILILDSDNWEAMYGTQVTVGDVNSRAIRPGQDNDRIDYFAVFIREEDGSQTSYVYETEKVWCVEEVHEYSNERNLRHQGTTTYGFKCLGSRVRVGW